MKLLALDLGRIILPAGTVPSVGGSVSEYVGSLIRNGILLLLIVSFIVAFIWIILAGLKFITASGDEKQVSSAWSQIYWGLIGLVVVVGSFAIIRLVETFFNVNIISGPFRLPKS